MSKIDLSEMEWENISRKNDLEINSLSLFQEIEKELGESLLEEKGEGDSTDGAFTFIENWRINYKRNLTKPLEKTVKKDNL